MIAAPSIAYDPDQWHDLFVAVAGASAALAGLIFVAVSINLARILAGPSLPGRAGETVAMLGLVLLESILVLVPGQSRNALGTELWILGACVLIGFAISWSRRTWNTQQPLPLRFLPAIISAAAALPAVIGGASVMAGSGGGLYWLVAGLIAGFAGSLVNAWVLLVEILR